MWAFSGREERRLEREEWLDPAEVVLVVAVVAEDEAGRMESLVP